MICADHTDPNSLGGDAPDGWRTPYVLTLLILGALLIIAFVFWEIKYPYSMIDMNIWKDKNFSLVRYTLGFLCHSPSTVLAALFDLDQ